PQESRTRWPAGSGREASRERLHESGAGPLRAVGPVLRFEIMEGRTPPHSIDAEMSVLGSIMLDNEVYATLEGTLSAEQFYKESHRKIFRAMEKLNRRGDPIDLVTLTEELRTAGELESIGSINYLIGMTDSVPTA